MCALMVTRSSLELMLDTLKQIDEQPNDAPPALPLRPASRGRLPRARAKRPLLADANPEPKVVDCSRKLGKKEEEEEKVRNCEQAAVLKKIKKSEETSHIQEEGILGIQKCFRGHQARCYYHKLTKGVTMLQSFVRGENARKEYQTLIHRLTAVVVIQRHVRRWIARGALKNRERAVIQLQSALRGWLTRKHLNPSSRKPHIDSKETIMGKPLWRVFDSKELVQVPSSVLVELQGRVARAEERLRKKEEESSVLEQRLLQSEKRWAEYEAKMRAMEEMWQTQLTTLQMTLGTAKKSLVDQYISDLPGKLDASPKHHYHNYNNSPTQTDGSIPLKLSFPTPGTGTTKRSNQCSNVVSHMVEEFEQHRKMFDDDTSLLLRVKESTQSAFGASPDDELRKLKLRYEAWNKDYKIRLQEMKTMLHRVGHSERVRSRRKWWEKLSPKNILGL